MMRILLAGLFVLFGVGVHAEPSVEIVLVDDPLEFAEVQLELRVRSDSYIILHSLELALSEEMERNRTFQERPRFADPALFSAVAHTDTQRKAIMERKVVTGEPEFWNRVVGPEKGLKTTEHVPRVVLGRAGPTRMKVRLLYEPVERRDLAGAQVKGLRMTRPVRSADAAATFLKNGELVLMKKDRPTGQVDAELIVDVMPRQPSFAQVSKDEGQRPFWFWDGLWLFRKDGVVSGLSARGERFVWEHVDANFFRYMPVHGVGSVGRKKTLMFQVDGDRADFETRFPELTVKVSGRGGTLLLTHLKTEIGDRGALEFSEKLAGTGWRLDIPEGIRRFRLYTERPGFQRKKANK